MKRINFSPARDHSVVTAQDVASRVGVSRATVSMAMSGTGRVSLRRRQQIKEMAQKMGYYPHAGGQLLRRSRERTGQWGVIAATDSQQQPFLGMGLTTAIGYFIRNFYDHDQRYVIEYRPYEPDENEVKPSHQVAAGLVDGSLVLGNVGEGLRRWLDEREGFAWVSVYEPAKFCVLSADHRGYYAVLQELMRLGHRHIACPMGPSDHLTHRLRLVAMRHAIRRLGLNIPALWRQTVAYNADAHYDWAKQVLSDSENRPTAIFCASMLQARTVCMAAAEQGLRIPEDLSLVAWGVQHDAETIYPKLAYISVDWQAIVAESVELLRLRLGGNDDQIDRPRRWVVPEFHTGPSLSFASH